MNILFITRGKLPLPNIKGGAVEYLIQLVIDENEKEWHDNFTVCTLYMTGLEIEQSKYRYCNFININNSSLAAKLETGIRYLINSKIRYIGNYFITKVLKELGADFEKFDVVINENAPDFISLIRDRYMGRFIFHAHNDWLNTNTNKILNYCDEYWPISKYLAEKVPQNEIACSVSVLYNGICLNDYQAIDKTIVEKYKKKLNLKDNDIVMVYAGRIVPEKGVLQMLHAFKQNSFSQMVKLVVVGGSFYSNENITSYMKKCIKFAEETTNILFTGYIPSIEVAGIYALSDIGVFPSICQEAFGLTILEMMASGLPIITTTNGAIPEIVNEDTGILLPTQNEEAWVKSMADAMLLLTNNKMLRESMGYWGKQNAKKFSAEKYLTEFRKRLHEVK